MTMRRDSIAFRLIVTALCWTLVALPLTGFLIHTIYAKETRGEFDAEVSRWLTVVLASSLDHTGLELGPPGEIGEALFSVPKSGWYWQITPIDAHAEKRYVSASLATGELPSPFRQWVAPDNNSVRWSYANDAVGQRVRIAEQIHQFGDELTGPRYSFIATGPADWPEAKISEFRRRVLNALSLVGLGFLAVTLFQVHFGLAPLRVVEKGLSEIRSGQASKLEGQFPAEIESLQAEINALIQSNQEIIDRARTQVGNLAHALKTPLAVITNEARDEPSPFGAKVAEQSQIMREQITTYLDRARTAAGVPTIGRVTDVKPAVEALQRALTRIYRDKGITIDLQCPTDVKFQGEKQDFEELLGNLLDNACKWAKSKVYVTITPPPVTSPATVRRLTIMVEDDGRGLTPDQLTKIGKRGLRLDEATPGTGLGLSIVNDLIASYRGTFTVSASSHGGLNARMELPAV
jgi:signal transduction histidine kinase